MWVDTPEEILCRALRAEADQVMPSPDALARIRARIACPTWLRRVRALFSRKPLADVPASGSETETTHGDQS